jgi:tRNA G46 methylase TrmB
MIICQVYHFQMKHLSFLILLLFIKWIPIRSYTLVPRPFRLQGSVRNCKYSSPLRSSQYDLSSLLKDKRHLSIEENLSQETKDKISILVQKRSDARALGDYETADFIRDEIHRMSSNKSTLIPEGYKIMIKDIPLKEGGGATWSLQPKDKVPTDCVASANKDSAVTESVLELAHSALGLASSSSEQCIPIDKQKLNDIVRKAKIRIKLTGEQDLRGRKAADAAFWFALSGVTDDFSNESSPDLQFSLFDSLTFICIQELDRFGKKSSCRPSDILHMVERIAAAGVNNDLFKDLQLKAAECLESKDPKDIKVTVEGGVLDLLRQGKFELHSERSLLWIWRFSTRQRKQRSFLSSAAKHWKEQNSKLEERDWKIDTIGDNNVDWSTIFDDPSRSLVLDIGCGMGVSILGLASLDQDPKGGSSELYDFDFNHLNFMGADLSGLAINYASSICDRWHTTSGKTFFKLCSAHDAVNMLSTYPGGVRLCTMQFPTPFKFNSNEAHEKIHDQNRLSIVHQGNQQLPSDAVSGFMVTKNLLKSIRTVLNEDGCILIQSNVEDVAVYMKDLAEEVGFQPLESSNPVEKLVSSGELPKRTQKWMRLGMKRAEGSIWSSNSILPKRGATETEVACLINKTPIHRCMMKKDIMNKVV